MNRDRFFFPTVLFLSLVSFLATAIYLPSFPAIQAQLHSSKSSVQLSLSLYMAGSSLSQLFYGPLSDRVGRKKVALMSLAIGFLGSLVCLFSFHVMFLILGRTLQGLGLGGCVVLFRTILRDRYSGDSLVYYGSFVAVATAVFMAIAPVLGGYIEHFMGWRMGFLFLILYIIGLVFLVIYFLPETNKVFNPFAVQKNVFLGNYLYLLKNPIFLGYACVASLVWGGLSAYLTSSPFLFQTELKLTPVQYGLLGWITGIGFGVGGLGNVFLVKKIGRHRSLVVGIGIICFAGFLMFFLSLLGFFNLLVIMLPMGIFSLGASMSFANSFAGAFQPFAKIAGFAGALYGCLQVLGGFLASSLMTVLNETTQMPLSIFLILVGLLSYFFQYWAFSSAKKNLP